MALDSALKRASALNVGSPWRGILPLPDGTVSKADRQTVGLHYSGILAAGLVTVPDVVGDTEAVGTATLQGDGFVVAVETAYSSTVPEGDIISQDPLGGSSAVSGSTVTITVSLGVAQSFVLQDTHDGGGRKRRKKDESILEKLLELFAEPGEAVAEIKEIVAPHAETVQMRTEVDWPSLRKDADAIEQLIRLYENRLRDDDDENDSVILLLQ